VAGEVRESIIVTGDNNSVTYIIREYLGAGRQPPDQTTLPRQVAGYLIWMRERFGTIELRGIKREGQQVVQLNLETVYVPLEAEALGGWGGHRSIRLNQVLGLKTQLDRPGSGMAWPVEKEGVAVNRLIITGGPGSGKTTVLQHIAWTLATAIAADDPAMAHQKLGLEDTLPLPIFIPLSAYAQHLRGLPASTDPRERTLAAFISRYLIEKQSGLDLPRDFFARLLGSGRAVILLLDGLDEVPNEDERARVRQAIEDLATGREKMRVAITCRTAAYRERTALGRGFREVRVKPLEDNHIKALVQRAYATIYPRDPTARQNKAAELLQGIRNLEQERGRRLGMRAERLITSPLLVRMLLVVHFSERRLPEQRAELYMKATDAMLLPEYAPDEETAGRIGRLVGGSREVHRELVQHLAFAMHRRGETQGREIGEDDLRKVLSADPSFAPLIDDFIALTRLRGTLLEERMRVYRFIHLAFQEYLVARYLAEIKRGEGGVDGIAAFFEEGPILDSWWRESALLVAGYLSLTSPQTARLFGRRLAGADEGAVWRPSSSPDVQMAAAEVAAMACLEWQAQDTGLRRALAERIAALFKNTALMDRARPTLRAAAGDALSHLGDPRFQADAWHLPDTPLLGFVEVPAGSFLMGSDKERDPIAYDDELSQHAVTLPAYYTARYPVTVAQFRVFVEDSGHKPAGEDSLRGVDNHPVVYVTWYDALAYCRWLAKTLQEWEGTPDPLARLLREEGWVITLPSEAEWEKAARGTDGRRFPWGGEPDPNRANYDQTGIGTTSAVGCFPGGASPYGVEDLSGNVWEWCRTKWEQDYENYRDDNDLEGEALRVARGGSFLGSRDGARCAFRFRVSPGRGWLSGGFRVVVSPISPASAL
jgi:formylglycine-generating enzyme required for sulfatase activity